MIASSVPWPTWVTRCRIKQVGNILRRHGIAPAPPASPDDFVERLYFRPHGRVGRNRLLHREVLTWRGLVTYYMLFFLHLKAAGSA
jgi:putative transposase